MSNPLLAPGRAPAPVRPARTGEFLAEIGRRRMIGSEIDAQLERYGRLDPALLRAVGGDKIPPTPLHAVPGVG